MAKSVFGKFDVLPKPARKRGAGRDSEILNDVRKLEPKNNVTLEIPEGKTLKDFHKSVYAACMRPGALKFKPYIEATDKGVCVYRDTDSEYAVGEDGSVKKTETGRRVTIADQK